MNEFTFADRLRVLREQRGLTQQEAAEAIGTGLRNYSNYENGKSFPSLPKLSEIARSLNVSESYFFEEKESEAEAHAFVSDLKSRVDQLWKMLDDQAAMGEQLAKCKREKRALMLDLQSAMSRIYTLENGHPPPPVHDLPNPNPDRG